MAADLSQIRERAMDLLEDMTDAYPSFARANGDHGFTKGARTAWRKQKRLALQFLRGVLIEGTSPDWVIAKGREFTRSKCPAHIGMSYSPRQRGIRKGNRWVMAIWALAVEYRMATRGY